MHKFCSNKKSTNCLSHWVSGIAVSSSSIHRVANSRMGYYLKNQLFHKMSQFTTLWYLHYGHFGVIRKRNMLLNVAIVFLTWRYLIYLDLVECIWVFKKIYITTNWPPHFWFSPPALPIASWPAILYVWHFQPLLSN